MQIFVTGGTGLLGNTLLREIANRGHESIAMVRGEPDQRVFSGIETEFARGDLSDTKVIDDAVARCDAVIHSAGLIHLGWTRLEESMRVNRDGTRNVVDACANHGKRLVHIGTVNTLAIGTIDGPSNENTPPDYAGGQIPSNYVLSKKAGVEEVLRGVEKGLDAVILHPGFMLGPYDWKPSSGRMILEVGKTWRPLALAGGCSVCDSRDVAKTCVDALTAEVENGRQYIVAGENQTYFDLWTAMAKVMGQRGPIKRLGPVPRRLGSIAGDVWARLTGHETDVNSAAIAMSTQYHWHDSTRAIQELGYRCRPAQESLEDAARWLKDLIKSRKPNIT